MHIHKAFRVEFVTSLLIAVFVFAMARAVISEPAPAYNCGDHGVRYCIAEYPTRSVVPQSPQVTVGPSW